MADEKLEQELTPQQDLFCMKYIECKRNASEAYRQSYNCEGSSDSTIWTNAHRLLHHTHVARRINQLFDEQAARLNVSMDSITEEYELVRNAAMKSGDYSPAVSAITGKAKLFGLITDKAINAITLEDKREKTEDEIKEELIARGIPVENIFAK